MPSFNDMIFQETPPDAVPSLEREAIESSEATTQLWRSGHNQLSYQGI